MLDEIKVRDLLIFSFFPNFGVARLASLRFVSQSSTCLGFVVRVCYFLGEMQNKKTSSLFPYFLFFFGPTGPI